MMYPNQLQVADRSHPRTRRGGVARRTIPALLAALFGLSTSGRAATYYIDASAGSDANNGTNSATPWQSLSKVNATTFAPGDRVLFKAGGSWTGFLNPKGSGAAGNPIVIDQYDSGAKPRIDGNGINGTGTTGGGAVYLYNQEHWEINNLEVVNDAASDGERRGIHIAAANFGTVDHIHIKNCHVHDIRGRLSTSDGDLIAKRTGGIIVEVTSDASVPTRFNDVLIEGNTITTVRNQGIVAAGNRSGQSDFPGTPGWLARRVSQLIIRSNTISDVTKNALILRLADNTCLVEHNVCFDTATLDTGNTMFTASCDGAVFQFNEGYRNLAGARDGSLYDADLRSVNIVFQYSYSHNNSHGLFWNYPDASGPNSNIVVRYNISRNDQGNLFSFSGDAGAEATTYIYNNTIYLPAGSTNLICDARSANHTYYMSNNIFYVLGSGVTYDFGSHTAVFDYNTFYGFHPASEPPDAHKLTGDPKLVAPGTGTNGIGTLGGYQLQAGSPCIDSGATVTGGGGRDFFGNSVPQGAGTDRGAHEFAGGVVSEPPAITQHPQSLTVPTGASASFSVSATGTAPLAYQWRKGGAPLSGETSTNLLLAAVSASDAGDYDVVVTNAVGSITSLVATLTVTVPSGGGGVVIAEVYNGGGKSGATYNRDYVVIKNNSASPVNLTNWSLQHLKAGVWQTPFVFGNVTLPAGGFFLVQCYYDGGASVGAAVPADAVTLQTSAWNFGTTSAGSLALVTNSTTLTDCASPAVADRFGWYATTGTCYEGLAVPAPGSATQSNQRLVNGCQDTGSNTNDFKLDPPTGRNSSTAPALCASCTAPAISVHPRDLIAVEGYGASLSVIATGSTPTYQWRRGGAPVSGATASTLSFNPVGTNDAGGYDVVVANGCGAITSAVAVLTVTVLDTNLTVNPTNYINPRFTNVTVTSGVKFADVVNYQDTPTSLLFDLYEPTGDSSPNRPVIVWIHGGGFRTDSSRTQSYIVTYATEFAKRGYVCLSIDYRLRNASDMPTQESELPAEQDAAADCNRAFQWVRTNAAAYRINTNWMFVAGGSAGGRTANVFSFHEGPDTNVCPTCSYAILTNGVNVVPPVNWDRRGLIANASLWGAPEPVMRWYTLDPADTPTVIIHGTADPTIDYQNAVDLYQGLTNVGVTVELHPLVGLGHTPTSANGLIISWVAQFFAQEWTKELASPTPPQINSAAVTEGSFVLKFSGSSGGSFTVLGTTNASLPSQQWVPLGGHVEISPGQFQFTDPGWATNAARYYRVRSP